MAEKQEQNSRYIQTLQLLSLLALAFSFWWAISSYSSLPQTYASHFDLSGNHDGWTTKSWFNVLLFPFIQLGLFLLMAGMTHWTAVSTASLEFINLPIDKKRLTAEKKDKVRWLTALSLGWINLFNSLLFAFINYEMLHSAATGSSPSSVRMMAAVILLLLCITVSAIWLTLAVKRVERE